MHSIAKRIVEMDGEEISIKVNIGNRHYPLKIDASEEEIVRKSAKLINEKALFYRENFSVKDQQDALAMAALEFTSDLLNLKGSDTDQIKYIDHKISQFNIMLNKVLT